MRSASTEEVMSTGAGSNGGEGVGTLGRKLPLPRGRGWPRRYRINSAKLSSNFAGELPVLVPRRDQTKPQLFAPASAIQHSAWHKKRPPRQTELHRGISPCR